jgi:hypothetical protein
MTCCQGLLKYQRASGADACAIAVHNYLADTLMPCMVDRLFVGKMGTTVVLLQHFASAVVFELATTDTS